MFRLLVLLAILVLSVRASAQNPSPQPVSPPDSVPRLIYPNAEVSEIFNLYEKLTGKRLIRPNQVMTGQIYIVINEELSREEAVRVIESSLLINGFSLVPTGDGKSVKVFGNGLNPRSGGVPIISDPELLPDHDQVVTFLFKLEYADPAEVVSALSGYIMPSQGAFNYVLPLPKSQTVLVTENATIIRGLFRVVKELDRKPAEVVSEFIKLERADAKDVLEKLDKIFEKQQQPGAGGAVVGGAPGSGLARTGRGVTPDGSPLPPGATAEATGVNSLEINAAPTLSEDSVIIGKIKLTADTRTNRIHVVTRPVNMDFIRDLVSKFDQNVPFGEQFERPLNFVTAADVIDPVVKAIQDPGAKDESSGSSAQSGGQTSGRNTSQNNSFGGGGLGGNGNNSFSGGGGSSSGSGGFSEELQTQEASTVPIAKTVGSTRIIADTRANKIIIIGNREIKDKIFKLLDRLDVRAPQVMLHTVIGQLELGKSASFGLDYILHKGGPIRTPATTSSSTTGGTGTGTTTTSNNNTITFNGNSPALNLGSVFSGGLLRQIATGGAGGLTGYIAAGNSLDIIVNALESTNRFKTIARPHVFTSNNRKAVIASGQEIAVPTQTLSSLDSNGLNQSNAAVSSSIQFKRVQLKLEVVPLINSEREVTMEIVQTIDEIVSGGDRIVAGNRIPTIANRYLKSTVSVPNESTLILGGLIRQADNKEISGIPYLSRLPLVGPLFRTTSTGNSRSELVILIRPVVSKGPAEAVKNREREQEFMQIEPDIESTVYPKGLRAPAKAAAPAFHTQRAVAPKPVHSFQK